MKVLIAAFVYCVLFVVVELVTKKAKIDKEVSRKFVHVVAGATVAFLPLFMTFHEIAMLSLLFIVVMLLSKKVSLFSSIHEVKRSTYGEVYFPFAILITALAFPHKELFMYGLLVMAISDGFAGIAGQKYGNKKYRLLGSQKSYVGSCTFFVTALLIGFLVLGTLTNLALIEVVTISALAGGILTIVEAGLSYGFDNLVLPPMAASLFMVLKGIFG